MRLIDSIRSALSRFVQPVKGMYEAGKRFVGGVRSYIHASYGDARFDSDKATRSEIARKARYFEANNAIVNRLADLFEQYTIGATGLPIIPATSDETFNQLVAREWEAWCERCDFNGQFSFPTIQSMMARSWFIDGEAILIKAHDYGTPAEPRIQIIEGHRVSSPTENIPSSRIVDGIEVDDFGRPKWYWVNTGFDGQTYQRKAISDIVHVWEPSRPGQLRGLSFLYPVLNDIHDLDDLQIFEMRAAKEAADTTTVVYNQTGELEAGQFGDLQRSRFDATVTNAEGTDQTVQREKFYRQAMGGRTVVAFRGDKVEQFASNRPTVATQGYWDHLVAKICVGVGMSKLLVFPQSMQGTVVRADLDVCDAFFRSRSSVIQGKVVEVYQWWLRWAVLNVKTLANPPKDFLRVTTRAPRSVKVDIGYDAAALLSELEAGTENLEGALTPKGRDWRKHLRQNAAELSFIRDLAAEFDVEPGQIAKKAAQSAQVSSPQFP